MTDARIHKWEAPPEGKTSPRGKWLPVAESLRSRPGEWALVSTGDVHTGNGGNIQQGRLACFRPAGSFEGVSRKSDDGTWNTWARYIGEGGEHR